MEFNFRGAYLILSAFGWAAATLSSIAAFCVDCKKTALAFVLAAFVFAFLLGGFL